MNIMLVIFYSTKGIKPILEFLFNEMVKNGYLKKNDNFFFENKKDSINEKIDKKEINDKRDKKGIKRKKIKKKSSEGGKKISNPNPKKKKR